MTTQNEDEKPRKPKVKRPYWMRVNEDEEELKEQISAKDYAKLRK